MTNPNEPAFPVEYENQSDADFKGLTKREYFAAMAMQGLLEASNRFRRAWLEEQIGYGKVESKIAAMAVVQADALISELNKEKP